MSEPLRTWERLLFGVVVPIGVMAFALFLVMLADTGAAAAEFASLGIFLGAIIVMPVVLIINVLLALQPADTTMICLRRRLVAPAIVVIGAIVYQTGLWDALT